MPNIPIDRAIAMLSTVKEFKNLSSEDLEAIAKVCHWHRYEANQDIVRYHDNTNSTFFIIQGEIRVTYSALSGHEVILCDLMAGEMFGELTAIDSQPRSASVIAKNSTLLASMPAADFLNLIYSNRQVAEAILVRLTEQIRRLTERVYDFSTLAVRNRIHSELLRLARNNMSADNAAVISPAPTHLEMANFVSTHREAVTRELQKLAKDNLVIRKGQDLHVLDVAKLSSMVDEVRGNIK